MLNSQGKAVNKKENTNQKKIPKASLKMANVEILSKNDEFGIGKEGIIIRTGYRDNSSKEFFGVLRVHRWKDFQKIQARITKSSSRPASQKLTDIELSEIATQISRNVDTFKQLKLCVSSDKLGNKGIEALAYHVGRNYPELRRILLEFPTCFDITNDGVGLFASEICKNMKHLERLTLKLKYCEKLKDKGIEMLGKEIGRYLTELQELELKFTSCWGISDKGLVALGSSFAKKLQKLQRLSLTFKA